MPTRSGPAILRHRAIVGGTVATQSRPSKTTNANRPMPAELSAAFSPSSEMPRRP
jgi:hypothetical protein